VAWRAEGRRRGLVLGGVMLAGILVPTAPWSAYASSVAGKPVPVSSGGASNLFVGTYVPGDGSMFGLKRELAGDVARMYPELRGDPFWRLPQQKVIDTVAARRPRARRGGCGATTRSARTATNARGSRRTTCCSSRSGSPAS
jgi:hypothetical protein